MGTCRVGGWAVATVLVAASAVAASAVAACSGDKAAAPSPPGPSGATSSAGSGTVTSPSAGQPLDYSGLLIQPGDLGGDFTAPQPPVLNPNNSAGVAQLFVNADNSRRIGDTILIVADPAAAVAGVDNSKANYASKVTGTWQPVDVGSNGAMISGIAKDNSQAITVLLFTEGKALVNLEFDSTPTDPIDAGVAADIGRKQDAAIRNGLPR